MPPDRRRRIEALYLEARDRTPPDRAALLASADADVRRAVEDRLAREALDAASGRTAHSPATPIDETSPALFSSDDRTVITPARAAPASTALAPGAEIGDYQIKAPLGAGGPAYARTQHEAREPWRGLAAADVPRTRLLTGESLGHYRVLDKVGEGGMGEVYRAHDRKLARDVAIKTLPSGLRDDAELLKRFRQEGRMLAALNHPNIAAIHDLEDWAGGSFLVLELVEGETLDERLRRTGPMPAIDALAIAIQVADALDAAHARGITHRDIKPSNVKLTPSGTVKVLDFGLAKSRPAPEEAAQVETRTVTQAGLLLGTPPYMSPEQVHGRDADHRSDLWALGCVLFELLSGVRAFRGETITGTLAAILEREPDWTALPAGTAPALRALLKRLLAKDPDSRYQSAGNLREDLAACRARLVSPGVRGLLRKPRVAVPAVAALVALAAGAAWLVYQAKQRSWAQNVALPEIARLLDEGNADAAFRLARQAERSIPDDPQLLDLRRHYAARVPIESTPPGADVYLKGYLNDDAEWVHVGRTPMTDAQVPSGYLRWRVTMDGFAPVERAAYAIGAVQFTLHPASEAPAGMTYVPGGPFGFRGFPPTRLEDFWLDTYEVTNQQFKRFVDAGGYTSAEYWTEPFVKGDAIVPWEEAVAALRDSTGRPGPATWALGSYPDGQDDFPVSGVSWYEAAAYAAFAGTRLPTVHQWLRAHATPQTSDILQVSNFGGEGPARVGSYAGMSPFGSYDMAGNVREWTWNAASPAPGDGRYILGASWREPAYRFPGPDVVDPWDRSAQNGFRTARYEPSPDGAAPVAMVVHDPTRVQPVEDAVFETYRRFYSYERTPLNPVVEEVDDTALHWRQERISFDAAYGGERVIAYLFLPRNAAPPYQTIVYFASGIARQSRSRDEMGSELRFVDFLPRLGRAVLFLVYKGTYERHIGRPATVPTWTRDLIISWSRDFSRAIDYLETRDDVDRDNLGYFSFSNPLVPVLSAIDGRIKAGAHIGAGLIGADVPDEFNAIHFAPRATEPTLLISGRYDFIGPVGTTQLPLLRLLGAPEADKKLATFETGHVVYPGPEMIKEVLDWFDRYLGPVALTPGGALSR